VNMATINSNDYTLADFAAGGDRDLFAKTRPCLAFIEDMKVKGTYTYRRALLGQCEKQILVLDSPNGNPRRMIMMASNNYLGLSTRPEVKAAAEQAIRTHGTGMAGAPLLNGTFQLLTELEERLATFVQTDEAMVFPTGYSANVGIISGLMRKDDIVLVDRLDHASIIDGCTLAQCEFRSFRHNDARQLEVLLKRYDGSRNGKLVVVDGVFSMEGDLADLPAIVQVAKKYGAKVMVDEAHALGVLGKHGAGSVEHFGLQGEVDIIMGTFSKSLCSTGGFAAASREVVNYLRHYARSYFFSATPVPSVAGTVLAALEIIEKEPQLREQLWENIHYFRNGLRQLGFRVEPNPPQSAIVRVIIGTSKDLRAISRLVHQMGVYVNSVEFPAVAKDLASLRIGLMATHTKDDLDEALEVLRVAGTECKNI